MNEDAKEGEDNELVGDAEESFDTFDGVTRATGMERGRQSTLETTLRAPLGSLLS
jgi:hypothetical protein